MYLFTRFRSAVLVGLSAAVLVVFPAQAIIIEEPFDPSTNENHMWATFPIEEGGKVEREYVQAIDDDFSWVILPGVDDFSVANLQIQLVFDFDAILIASDPDPSEISPDSSGEGTFNSNSFFDAGWSWEVDGEGNGTITVHAWRVAESTTPPDAVPDSGATLPLAILSACALFTCRKRVR